MNPITEPTNIAQRIAQTEAAIAASNARIQGLRQNLKASARRTLRGSPKPLIIGGIVLVATGLLVYPRRHAIARRARRVLDRPIWQTLIQRLPLIGLLMPLLSSAAHRDGATPTSKWAALLTTALPLLSRFFPNALAGLRPPAH
jgi:hypothetical protein